MSATNSRRSEPFDSTIENRAMFSNPTGQPQTELPALLPWARRASLSADRARPGVEMASPLAMVVEGITWD